MKTCIECHQTKDDINFGKCVRYDDGLRPRCKNCHNAQHRERQRIRKVEDPDYAINYSMQHSMYQKNRKLADNAFLQKCRRQAVVAQKNLWAASAEYQKKHREYYKTRKERDPEYAEAQRELAKTRHHIKWKNDPIYRAKIAHRNHVRKLKIEKQFKALSSEERSAIILFYANRPKGYEVDHIYPLVHGGLHCLSNLQYLPAKENRGKSSKILPNTSIRGIES
mgnify:CR=1 FL=1